MTDLSEYNAHSPTWCPGCGDWGINVSIKSALKELNIGPSQFAAVFGIGCSGNMNDFLNAYAMHALHGRAIPNAIGIKLAYHSLPVLVIVGDGDCYGEGGNHLIHACRGNHDITVIVHDNGVYGLTTGQVAPTADKGFKSKSTPNGIIENPLNPLSLVLTQGATFVAQSFAGDVLHTIETIKQAIAHKGFSLVNVLQPCVTFNKINTYQYYLKRVYKLSEDHDRTSFSQALAQANKLYEERFPLGILYQVQKPSYHEQLPQVAKNPLRNNQRFIDVPTILDVFR